MTRTSSSGDKKAEAPLSADDRLALVLADMLAEVLAKEATTPLGVAGPQDVRWAAREPRGEGGET